MFLVYPLQDDATRHEHEREAPNRRWVFSFFILVGAEVGLSALLRHRLTVRLHELELCCVGGEALVNRVSEVLPRRQITEFTLQPSPRAPPTAQHFIFMFFNCNASGCVDTAIYASQHPSRV